MSHLPRENEEQAALRAYLAERDVACPGCGYNLRGLTGDDCPECGCALSVLELRRAAMGLEAPMPSTGLAIIIGAAWAFMFVSSSIRFAADRVVDGQAAFGLIPAMWAGVPAVVVAFACLFRFTGGARAAVRMIRWIIVIAMAAIAVLVWF